MQDMATTGRIRNSTMFQVLHKLDKIRYLLTAVGLSPGGSTHLHTNNT